MMRFPVASLLFLPLFVSATPWRTPSNFGGTRLPLVFPKDFSARSLSSLTSPNTFVHRGGSGSSSSSSSRAAESDVENSFSDEDNVRVETDGTISEAQEDVDTKALASKAAETADAAAVVDDAAITAAISEETASSDANKVVEKAHHSHVKKRRRRKKEKLDGPHAMYAKKLKNRNHTNIRRKVMHACFGLGFGALNYYIPKSKFVPGMTILTSATLLMELLRYRRGFGWMNDALHWVLGGSLRKHEMEGKFTGSFYFFFGVTMTAALYPKTCASMGMWQLALADPSASYFGRQTRHVYWSRIENGFFGFGRNKGLLGFLGGALFCFPFNYRVLSIAKFGLNGVPGGQKALVGCSLALGFAGALADLAVPTPALTMPKKVFGVPVPPFHVDDNFVVPIVSGFACTKIFAYLGWPGDLQLGKYIIF